MNVTDTVDFYRWLRERSEKRSHVDNRIHLEIPLPPRPVSSEEKTTEERGVWIMDLG